MGIISNAQSALKKALGIEQLKKQSQNIKELGASIFMSASSSSSQKAASQKETFEEAMIRLNLTQEDIQQRAKEFQRLIRLYSAISLGLMIYFICAVFQKVLIASLGTLGIFLMVIAQLFRYHFWYFQIKQRRLGCTFKEWRLSLMGQNRGNIA